MLLMSLLVIPFVSAEIDTNTRGNLGEYVAEYAINSSGAYNAIDDYSNGNDFVFVPVGTNITRVARVIITVADMAISDADDYGSINQLPTGVAFFVEKNGTRIRIDGGVNTTTNGEYQRISYDVSNGLSSLGNGKDYVAVRWTFAKSGTDLRLDGAKGDKLVVALHDDFSGLNDHVFVVQGYNETPTEVGMSYTIAVIIMYVAAATLFAVYGFLLKDKAYKEIITDNGKEIMEQTNGFLSALKMLFLMSVPGLALLGIHIAREIAIDAGASSNVTDSLATGFQIMMWLTIIALFAFVVILARNVFVSFIKTSGETIKEFRNKG